MSAPLIADRFVPLAGDLVFDLGTGTHGVLRTARAAAAARQRAWNTECAALAEAWHPALAEILDFGVVGEGHTFAVFGTDRPGPVRRPDGRAVAEVEAFLVACGARMEAARWEARGEDGHVLVPWGPRDDAAGDGIAADRSPGWWGVRLIQRAARSAVIERLEANRPPGLLTVGIEAVPGSGGRTLLRQCARDARLRGYVPIDTRALTWLAAHPGAAPHGVESWLDGRHVCLLHDGRDTPLGLHDHLAANVLRIVTRTPRPHVLVELAIRPAGDVHLLLAPIPDADLVASIVAPEDARALRRRARRMAVHARGRPGLLVAALRRSRRRPRERRAGPSGCTVHESHAVFEGPRAPGTVSVPALGLGWPAPVARGALPAPTKAEEEAVQARAERLRVVGRHAAAERLLRAALGAATRRRQWTAAAVLALAASRLALSRGRADDARALARASIEWAARAGNPRAAAAGAIGLAAAAREDADFLTAECGARVALAMSALGAWPQTGTSARAELARCLWWTGRMSELPPPALAGAAPADAAAEARRHIWLGDLDTAGRVVAAADLASASPEIAAEVWLLRACLQARTGDADAFRATVARVLQTARAERHPLIALECRLLLVEGSLRLGHREWARRSLPALRRAADGAAPALLRTRIVLVLALLTGSPEDVARAERAARAAGVLGLARGHPGSLGWPESTVPRRPPMLDDVLEVLEMCQADQDPPATLERVALLVRERTRASTVVFAAAERGHLSILAPRGTRVLPAAAARAVELARLVAPADTGDGIEAAAPVRYGPVVVGALACRWVSAPVPDPTQLEMLLSATAAAAAPCVRLANEPRLPVTPNGIDLLGTSDAIESVRRAVSRAADAPFPVLVTGESGSGKELVARAIHRSSARRARAFCALNCAALPDDLLEAELFGHVRGAFTGAVADRAGLFEQADGGVLFLDEVGELSPRGQAKLLRVIQEGELRRVGETVARRVDVRIVAATNRALEQEVAAGRFRRDLWYRLDVLRVSVPPLRERPDDIPLLATAFWRRAAERVGSRAVLSDATLGALARYDWPGNVRELQNVLAALVVTAPRRGLVGPALLPSTVAAICAQHGPSTLDEARRLFEERFVRAALARAGGHRGRAAAELGITRQGLAKVMERLGVADRGRPHEGASRSDD